MTRIPLVLLPGLGSDAAIWATQVRDLGDVADVEVGDTLHDDTLPAIADRILAAAPPRFALAGLSMGGYVAFEILRRAPDRVLRLALCDTGARPDTPEQTAYRRMAIAAIASGRDYAALARASLGSLLAPDAPAAVGDAIVAMALRVGPATYVRQLEAVIPRPDSRPLLAQIAVPTLVLVGELDALSPPALAREMADAVPGATFEVVAGSGHLPPIERPAETTACLRAWLAG